MEVYNIETPRSGGEPDLDEESESDIEDESGYLEEELDDSSEYWKPMPLRGSALY